MFYAPIENFTVSFFTLIAFLVIIVSIGDSLRILLRMSLISPFSDAIFLTLLFSNLVALILDFFHLFTHVIIYIIIMLFIIIRIFLFFYQNSYSDLKILLKENKSYSDLGASINRFLHNLSFSQSIFILLATYLLIFIVGPAIIYPLPLQTDMKHHTLFVWFIYSQQTTFPSWTPTVPIFSNVLYQLGGHVFSVWIYTLVAPLNLPVITFVNFIFRFLFICLFVTIIQFVNKIYPLFHNINHYIAVTLLLIPSLFFVSRWGGFSWLFGLFLIFYLIFLTIKPLIEPITSVFEMYMNQILFLIGLGLLGFFHINALFYFFLYLCSWLIALIFRIISIEKETIVVSISSVLSLFVYISVVVFPHDFLSFLPSNIQQMLLSTSYIIPEGSVDFVQIFLFNFFIGGLVSIVGLIIFFLNIKQHFKPYVLLLVIWTILFLSISFIFQVFRFNDIIDTFFTFPGAQYMVKSERMLYFSFIFLIIFAPYFWNHFEPVFNKFNKNFIPIFLLVSILGFSLVSFYVIQLPDSRDYNSYTIQGYHWVNDNVPENSYVMNDYWGQWLPLASHVRVSFPYDPLYQFANTKTPFIFYDLLLHETNTTAYNSSLALSSVNFKDPINYIFITHHVFDDIIWKLGQNGYNNIKNRSIYSLSTYSNLDLVYSNPDVAIYHVLW